MSQEASADVRIVNASGLHARPSHAIVKLALAHRSELTIRCGSAEVNGRSILDLMTLGAPCDAILSLRARGEDATELISALVKLIEGGFGEQS